MKKLNKKNTLKALLVVVISFIGLNYFVNQMFSNLDHKAQLQSEQIEKIKEQKLKVILNDGIVDDNEFSEYNKIKNN